MKNKLLYKIGWGLIVVSVLWWGLIVVVPFFPLSLKMKATVITAAIVLAEVFFWLGAVLVGKEVVAKYKAYLNPKNWGKKKDDV